MRAIAQVVRTVHELRLVTEEWLRFLAGQPHGANMRNDPRRILLVLEQNPAVVPRIVLVRRGGLLTAVAPFHIEPTSLAMKWGPRAMASFPVRSMQIFGDALVTAGAPDVATFEAAFDGIAASREFDVLTIHSVPQLSPLWRYCKERLPVRHRLQLTVSSAIETVHEIELDPDHAAYLARLGPKTRQNLRRTTRRLLESGGRLLKVTTPEAIPEFLDHVDRIFQRSWQARTIGRRARNARRDVAYFAGLARHGWLRAYVLMRGDHPLAYEIGFQYGGTFYGHECAYDEGAAADGPGSVLMHLVIEDLFHDARPERIDFGFGHADYKERLGSRRRHDAAHLTLTPPNRWRALATVQRTLDRLHRVIGRSK